MEAASSGDELLVVRGVEGVEDGLGQGVPQGQTVQQRGQRGGRDAVADGVASYVGTQSLEPLSVQVAQGSQVQLHGEAPGSVLPTQEVHEQGLVGRDLVVQGRLPV